MQKLQLYIEGDRIDLFKDETVSITQTIQNVKDPAKIFTSFTKTFSVPASNTNNKLFKHYYNYDIVDGFDARIKKAGIIELNTIPYKEGRIKLEGVDLKNNLAHTYRITFFGNTVELPDIISGDKLGSLNFADSQYLLDYSPTRVKDKLQVNLGNVIAPLITHTQQLYYNSTTSIAGDGNLYYASNLNQGVIWNQLKYALRLYQIILEIELKYNKSNGYAANIVFSRDFFNTNNPTFYNLYMWLHRKSGAVDPVQQVASFLSIVPSWGNSSTQLVQTFGPGVFIESSILIYPFALIFNTLSVTTNDTTNPYTVVIIREIGNSTSVVFESASGTGSRSFSNPITLSGNATYQIAIRHSTTIVFTSVRWFLRFTEDDDPGFPPQQFDEDVKLNNFTALEVIDFSVADQIPDVGIMEFLTGLFKMFNLVAYVNDTGTIVVRPLEGSTGISNSYYTSSDVEGNDAPVNYNISDYIDTTKSQVNVALPYNEILYRYEGLGTLLAKQHEQLSGSGWGSLGYIGGTNTDGTGDGVNYNASTTTYKVLVPFEHMKYERLLNGADGDKLDIQWGFSVNENSQPYIGKPLIFYAIRQTNATPISFVESANTRSVLTSYIIPSNSVYLNSSTGKQNINFNLELNEFTNTNTFTDTLFTDYHRQYILDVFNESRRITRISAVLPLRILYNFKLNDTFTINQRTYIINSITTNLQNGESKMELLNKVSSYFGVILNVSFQGSLGVLYYGSSVGEIKNLAVGDIIFSNKELTTFPSAGTYTQQGVSNDTTRYCDTGGIMVMVLGTGGVISSIVCGSP